MRMSTSQLTTNVSSAVSSSLNEPIVVTLYNRPVAVIVGLVPEQIDEEGNTAGLANALEACAKMLRAGVLTA